jgi:hypothetical protein
MQPPRRADDAAVPPCARQHPTGRRVEKQQPLRAVATSVERHDDRRRSLRQRKRGDPLTGAQAAIGDVDIAGGDQSLLAADPEAGGGGDPLEERRAGEDRAGYGQGDRNQPHHQPQPAMDPYSRIANGNSGHTNPETDGAPCYSRGAASIRESHAVPSPPLRSG